MRPFPPPLTIAFFGVKLSPSKQLSAAVRHVGSRGSSPVKDRRPFRPPRKRFHGDRRCVRRVRRVRSVRHVFGAGRRVRLGDGEAPRPSGRRSWRRSSSPCSLVIFADRSRATAHVVPPLVPGPARRLLAVLAPLLLVAAFLGPSPPRRRFVEPNASYVLVNRNSGKALDVYNMATSTAPAVSFRGPGTIRASSSGSSSPGAALTASESATRPRCWTSTTGPPRTAESIVRSAEPERRQPAMTTSADSSDSYRKVGLAPRRQGPRLGRDVGRPEFDPAELAAGSARAANASARDRERDAPRNRRGGSYTGRRAGTWRSGNRHVFEYANWGSAVVESDGRIEVAQSGARSHAGAQDARRAQRQALRAAGRAAAEQAEIAEKDTVQQGEPTATRPRTSARTAPSSRCSSA